MNRSRSVILVLALLAPLAPAAPASAGNPVRVAAFTALDDSTVAAQVDAATSALGQDANARVLVLAYGGRHFVPNEARRLGFLARQTLIDRGPVDSTRVILIDGGYRVTHEVELWIVPEGADLPTATPTLEAAQVLKGWKRRPPPKKK